MATEARIEDARQRAIASVSDLLKSGVLDRLLAQHVVMQELLQAERALLKAVVAAQEGLLRTLGELGKDGADN